MAQKENSVRKAAEPPSGGGKSGNGKRKQQVRIVEVAPVAGPAKMRQRHWGVLLSFLIGVVAPLAITVFYLYARADDQYASVTGFTVRQEEGNAASILGGLSQFTGTTAGRDADVLYQFIQSQDLVVAVNERLDLAAHYSANRSKDPVFALRLNPSIEDLVAYWRRVVRVSYDQATGLIELQIRAFEPEFAREVGRQIVLESQNRINMLNLAAREDAMRYAEADLGKAVAQLKSAREALTRFRTRTQIVDPATDIQGRLGVMNNLQQQLATALVEYDLLKESSTGNDPRVEQARQKIDVIRERIADERRTFATDSTETGAIGEDYPTLIAEYESLTIDAEVAEQRYRTGLGAFELARANADRQSRYLAAYIEPTLAETAEYPQRILLTALAALVLIVGWSILVMVYYSIRDRR